MPDLQLHEIAPREQVGAQTGALYEYQYHQAAAEALLLLTDDDIGCIYCEWHDDFVSERACTPCYDFHQVKTRTKSKGPWRATEFFGLKKKLKGKPDPASDASCIFAYLWDHTTKFGLSCHSFVFVTDAGIESDFAALLNDVHACMSPGKLSGASATLFQRIVAQSAQTLTGVTESSLFSCLSILRIGDAIGSAQDLDGVKALLASRVFDSSEVDLLMSEARKIGAELVDEVRHRSHLVLVTLPGTTKELRKAKGLVIDDVLKVLSLSVEGYRQLRQEGKDAVRTLSRLHRLCRKSQIPEEHIPLLCTCKLAWASWWLDERDKLDAVDVLALRHDCAELLKAHVAGSLGFSDLLGQATALADRYRSIFTSFKPITSQGVFGLLLEIAVESEDHR